MISHIDIGHNGRMGNQLFIYSLLYKLKTQGKEVTIPSNSYILNPEGSLDRYHKKWIPYKYVLDDYFSLSISSSENIPNNIWEESSYYKFYPEVFDLDNISLKGYFQSWKYFDDIREEIKTELNFKSSIKEKVNSIFSKFKNKPTIGIHIRLGDALAYSHTHILSPEYIQKCFSYFPQEEFNFIIASDNLEYCKEWFSQGDNIYFTEELNEAETLYILSLCDHFIMSKSTFSWWAAYLGQKEHSIVLFPNHYYNNDEDLQIFYHPTWKLIN